MRGHHHAFETDLGDAARPSAVQRGRWVHRMHPSIILLFLAVTSMQTHEAAAQVGTRESSREHVTMVDFEALTRSIHESGKYFYADFNLLSWAVVFLGIGLHLLHQGHHVLVEARRSNPALPSPDTGLYAAFIISAILCFMHITAATVLFRNVVSPLLNSSPISLFIFLPGLSFQIVAWAAIPVTIVAAYFFLISGLAISGSPRFETTRDEEDQPPLNISQSKVSVYLAVGGFIASVLAVTANVVKIIEFSR